MSFFQSIWSDLVERRLLPVVILLVAGLVAIPFVIKSKDNPAPATIDYAGTNTGQGAQPANAPDVKLIAPDQLHRVTSGRRNPFAQPKFPKPKAQIFTRPGDNPGTSTPPPTPAPAPTPAPTPPNNPYVPPTPSTPKPGDNKPKTPDTSDYKVTLRVGQAGNLAVHKDVERLTPLPSTIDPFFVFMGVMKDGETAVFLLSSDAKATGDGLCKPSPTNCQTIEMKAQDVEFFDVTGGDGITTQYELDLTRIVKTHSSSTAASASAHSATARTGASVIDQTRASGSEALSGYSYDPSSGTLQRELPALGAVLPNIAAK